MSKLTSAPHGSDPILVSLRNVECPGDVPQVGSTNANLKRGIQGISGDVLVDLIQANDIRRAISWDFREHGGFVDPS